MHFSRSSTINILTFHAPLFWAQFILILMKISGKNVLNNIGCRPRSGNNGSATGLRHCAKYTRIKTLESLCTHSSCVFVNNVSHPGNDFRPNHVERAVRDHIEHERLWRDRRHPAMTVRLTSAAFFISTHTERVVSNNVYAKLTTHTHYQLRI